MSASYLRAPSLFEIFISSILSVLLGAVIAATILILKPVEILTEAPKDKPLDATKIYFFQGHKDYTPSLRWRFKRDSLVQGHSVSMNEDELNTWIEDVYPKIPLEQAATKKPNVPAKVKGKDAAPVKPSDSSQPFIQTGTPNFRLTSETLRMGVVYYVNLFGYGSFEIVAQSEGTFEKPKDNKEPIRYTPSTFYIGSLPVHKLLMLKGPIFKRIVDTFEFPAELTEAWSKLADVKVENRELVLGAPAATTP
jgi:hypothetical protein